MLRILSNVSVTSTCICRILLSCLKMVKKKDVWSLNLLLRFYWVKSWVLKWSFLTEVAEGLGHGDTQGEALTTLPSLSNLAWTTGWSLLLVSGTYWQVNIITNRQTREKNQRTTYWARLCWSWEKAAWTPIICRLARVTVSPPITILIWNKLSVHSFSTKTR